MPRISSPYWRLLLPVKGAAPPLPSDCHPPHAIWASGPSARDKECGTYRYMVHGTRTPSRTEQSERTPRLGSGKKGSCPALAAEVGICVLEQGNGPAMGMAMGNGDSSSRVHPGTPSAEHIHGANIVYLL